MADITLRVQHSKETIMRLSYTQYSATYGKKKAISVLAAIVCLLLGSRLIGDVAVPYNYLFSLYGCFSIVFLNYPAKRRAEQIISKIEKSAVGYPCSVFHFRENEFVVTDGKSKGKEDKYLYSGCHKLLEHRDAYYYFINQHAAFLFPFDVIPQKEMLKKHLEEKTGLRFQPLNSWWRLSLRTLLFAKKNTR